MDPVVAHARHVAARAAHADTARREGVAGLVGKRLHIVRNHQRIGIGRRRCEPFRETGKSANRQIGCKRRPRRGFGVGSRPDLGIEGAFRRLRRAERGECAAELDVAGADVGDGEVDDGALGDRIGDNNTFRQEGGVHGVEVGFDTRRRRDAVAKSDFIHQSKERTGVRATSAADIEMFVRIGGRSSYKIPATQQDAVFIQVSLATTAFIRIDEIDLGPCFQAKVKIAKIAVFIAVTSVIV